ncbi:MAG: hypothetical protein EOP45_07480 [Sphingobacteriaceae bacterium]|nr:MAG: hypothetical protein EOP45_07480 [Sphingobacteriaceae bacterium]
MAAVILPAIFKLPPTPTPPVTIKAPVVVVVDAVLLLIFTAVENDLFDSTSVVDLPTNVSADEGNVKTPPLFKTGLFIVGAVNVLLVKVSVVDLPNNVSVEVGKVNVPTFVIVEIVGAVNVLFVNVSTVIFPTSVSVASGNVIVLFTVFDIANVVVFPVVVFERLNTSVFEISVAFTIAVELSDKFLFNKVSVVDLPTNVSANVGNVNTPPLFKIGLFNVGTINVLFVNVSVVALPTNVSADVGNVNTPPLFKTGLFIVGAVNVLFVKVSAVALPISVSVASGNVIVFFLL